LAKKKTGVPKFWHAICLILLLVCMVETWSRGAWLGLIFAALLFLFMWHRRSVWVILAGIASIPILPMVLPASIVSRFTSIGNMTDSSTSYRVYIWRAVVNMLEDYSLTGIGIGESAWDRIYPMYSYNGIEAAPHSHNLYFQIWLENGLCGILVFLLFLFLLYQSGFTLFSKLSGKTGLITTDISERVMRENVTNFAAENIGTTMDRGKAQLRISVAGPLCGILAVMVQSMTDYTWYNYRLFLMFWLVCGLASAYAKNGNGLIRKSYDEMVDTLSAEKEVVVERASLKKLSGYKKEKENE
jgi:hypothetical protein